MLASGIVPPAVPSLRQIPTLCASPTVKITAPPTTAISRRDEPVAPGAMSFTRAVPAAVPSLRHSSCPWIPSFAVHSTREPRLRKFDGLELFAATSEEVLPIGTSFGAAEVLRARAARRRADAARND